MVQRLKLILWVLPFLGAILGYAYANVFFHGLLKPWLLVGKPGEKIVQIMGMKESRKLLVTSESGNLYSFEFTDEGEEALPFQSRWKNEEHDTVDPVSTIDWGADFVTWSPPFQVVQLYEVEYLYKVEGKGERKFALDTDGNLWIWTHRIAGLTGLVFYFYPTIGFLVGLFIILLTRGISWLRENRVVFKGKIAGQAFFMILPHF